MIVDLSCPIEVRGYELLKDDLGNTRAYIRLFNLSTRAICGYAATINWFNECTQNSEIENLTVDKLDIPGRSAFKLIQSTKSRVQADHVEMYFSSVDFGDGTRWTPHEDCVVDMGEQTVLEGEALDLLKSAAGDDAVQFPQVQNKYWRCVCGRINLLDWRSCVRCGRDRNDVLKNLTRKAVVGRRAPRVHRPPATNAYQEKQKKRRSDAFLKAIMVALMIILFALVGFGLGKGGPTEPPARPETTAVPAMYEPGPVNADHSPYFSSNMPS